MRPLRLALTFAMAAAMACMGARAQPVHAGGAMATRSVSHYLALERALQDAVAARDSAGLQARISPDFTYRSPASPDVLDRQAWMERESHRAVPIRDLTVREEEGIAVVSFLAGKRFVVDVWKGETLLSRSAAISPEAARAPARPSGRE
jgi:hypothetical protein